jgi:hypothetical protein
MDLIQKYPNITEKIERFRANGYTDEQIEQSVMDVSNSMLHDGKSIEEVRDFFGISEEQINAFRLGATSDAKAVASVLSVATGRPQEQVTSELMNNKALAQFDNFNKGKQSNLLFENASATLDFLQKLDFEVYKAVEVDKKAPASMFGVLSASDQKGYTIDDPFAAEHLFGYGAGKFAWGMGKQAWNLTALSWDVLDKVTDFIVPDGSWLDQHIKGQVSYWQNPEDNNTLARYVSAVGSARREAYYDRGFWWGITNDLSDISMDFATMMGGYRIFSGVVKGHLALETGMSMFDRKLNMLSYIKDTAKMQATHAFLTTEGSIKDRAFAALYRVAYNLTPYVANATGATGLGAVFTDTMLNTFLTSPHYYSLYKEYGLSEDFAKYALPQIVMDVGMAWNTRGEPARARAAQRENLARLKANATGLDYRTVLDDMVKQETFLEREIRAETRIQVETEERHELKDGWIPTGALVNEGHRAEFINKIFDDNDWIFVDRSQKKPWEMTKQEFSAFVKGGSDALEGLLKTKLSKGEITKEDADVVRGAIEDEIRAQAERLGLEYEQEARMQQGESASEYYAITSFLRQHGRATDTGGISYAEMVRLWGIDDAREINRHLPPGAVRSRGGSLDTVVSVLRDEGGFNIRDENHLRELLLNRPSLSRTQAEASARGELEDLALLKNTLHKAIVKGAIDRGVGVPPHILREYPDLIEGNEDLVKIPQIQQVRQNPEVIKTILDGEMSLGAFNRTKPENLGLSGKGKTRIKQIIRDMLTDMISFDSNNVQHDYRVQIQNLLDEIKIPDRSIVSGPRTRSEIAMFEDHIKAEQQKAIESAERQGEDPDTAARAVREHILNSIHPKQAELLVRELLNDKTVNELVGRYSTMKALYDEGRKEYNLWLARRAQAVVNFGDPMKAEMSDPKNHQFLKAIGSVLRRKKGTLSPDVFLVDKILEEKSPNAIAKVLQAGVAYSARPTRILTMLQGGKQEGPFTDLWKYVEDKWDAKLRMENQRKDVLGEARDKRGLTLDDINRMVPALDFQDVTGHRFRVNLSQALEIYAYSQNKYGRMALYESFGLDERYFDLLEITLKDNEKEYAWDVIREQEAHFDRAQKALVEHFNRGMTKEENYLRIFYTDRAETDNLVDDYTRNVEMEVARLYQLRDMSTRSGFRHERKGPGEGYRLALRGIEQNWQRSMTETEHFIHLAEPVRIMNALWGKGTPWGKTQINGTITKEIEANYGKNIVESLRSYSNSVADPYFYRADRALNSWIRLFRENMALAYLAYNVTTMAKQLPSMIFYGVEAGFPRLMATCLDVATNWEESRKLVEALSPQLKARGGAVESVFLEIEGRTDLSSVQKYSRGISGPGMKGIALFDKVATTIGFMAVYEKHRDMGWTEDAAARRATQITLETQPAATAKDLAMLYKQGELMRTFLMFSNQLNNIFNMATMDSYNFLARKEYTKFAANIIALALGGTMIQSIARKKLPEEVSDVAGGFTYQIANSLPLIGKAVGGAFEGYRANMDPFSMIGYWVGKMGKDAQEGKSFSADMALNFLSVMTGLPYSGSKRAYYALKEGDLSYLLGGKPSKKKKSLLF